ncbi:MAG TPA: hypothetical protein EYN91_03115 [Candidatus Melainabacteria bacterium]|jgi:hypothetical protein|nr:hypothetical protein [Candidatus Melainabacteria bacterium]HIN63334.1 hypothetical protein [Candidatus Obscuribacterales bacterium]
MAREKQKEKKPDKIVEVSAEVVEDDAPAVVSEPPSTNGTQPTEVIDQPTAVRAETFGLEAEEMPVSEDARESVPKALAPSAALKTTFMRALPFVVISVLLFGLPFLLTGTTVFWLSFSQVRTYMLGALIWNLIGACLYAQVDKRSQKIILIIIFALPLITSHYWARFMYMVEMFLRSTFNAPL